MICAELELDAIGCDALGGEHHSGVVDQQIDPWIGCLDLGRRRPHRRQ
jgi:hypothetical protein